MVDLGTLPGSPGSKAYGVNDSAEIVGFSYIPGGPGVFPHAFSYTPSGGMVDLGTLPGDIESVAFGVNDNGEIVGYSRTFGVGYQAFSYTPSGGMVGLGTLGGVSSFAQGVNDSGEIVGHSETASGANHAFSYTPSGRMVDLSPLSGTATNAAAVNGHGQIVGGSSDAFSYTPSGGFVDLGTLPGGTVSFAQGVNDSGEIVGYSESGPFSTHAVLWTPAADTMPPVITVPAGGVTVDATSPQGAVVTYTVTATDNVDGPVTPSCSPASGSLFAIGTTTVTCTATDRADNTARTTFSVKVKGAATQIGGEITFVQGSSLPALAKQSLTDKLNAAATALAAGNKKDADNNLDAALSYIKAQSGKSIPTGMAAQLTADINRIKAVIG